MAAVVEPSHQTVAQEMEVQLLALEAMATAMAAMEMVQVALRPVAIRVQARQGKRLLAKLRLKHPEQQRARKRRLRNLSRKHQVRIPEDLRRVGHRTLAGKMVTPIHWAAF